MDTATQEPLTDTLKPIYAHFVFREHPQALAFAASVVERDWKVNVTFTPERALWQATVRRTIRPVFSEITIWLTTLVARATPLDGKSDGWGHEP